LLCESTLFLFKMKSKHLLILPFSVLLTHCNEPNTVTFAETTSQEDTTSFLKEQPAEEEEKIIGETQAGYYFYMADAAIFTLCETGNKHPVLQEEANIDAEKIFLNSQTDDDIKNVFMTVRMSYKDAPNAEGNIVKQILIHEVIEKIEDCP
jgi:uncharacterized lipoprotein NlpE involved in copper resistance